MTAVSPTSRVRLFYRIATGLLALQMLLGASMYLIAHDVASESFTHLGFPTWLIVPLAVAKLLGVAAVLIGKSRLLKDLAYAGFFYNTLLAVLAHLAAGDGAETIPAALAVVLVVASFHFDRKSRSPA